MSSPALVFQANHILEWPDTDAAPGTFVPAPIGHDISPMLPADVEAIINKAIEIDPVKGNALKAKVVAGNVGFVEYQGDVAGELGIHDHNTIAINTDPNIPLGVKAVTALHEGDHLDNATAASGGDSRSFADPTNPWAGTNTCFLCTHADMGIESYGHIKAAACEPGLDQHDLDDYCTILRGLGPTVAGISADCLAEACPGAMDPSWIAAICTECQ